MGRETWIVTNVGSTATSLGDLNRVPILSPNERRDLLAFYKPNRVLSSSALAGMFNAGTLSLTKTLDGNSSSYTGTAATQALTRVDKKMITTIANEYGGNISILGQFNGCGQCAWGEAFTNAYSGLEGSMNNIQINWPDPMSTTDNLQQGGVFLSIQQEPFDSNFYANVCVVNPQFAQMIEMWGSEGSSLFSEVVDFSSFTNLNGIWYQNDYPSVLNLSNLANLRYLYLGVLGLTDDSIEGSDFEGMTEISSIELTGNTLSSTSIDAIINAVAVTVQANPRSGMLYIQNNPSEPSTDASAASLAILNDNGWTTTIS